MATIKKVQVEARMGEGFTIESQIRDHKVYIDQPNAMGGTDKGPTPLEYLMFSMAGCMASIGRIIANQRKLPVRGMTFQVEGELNLDYLLGQTTDGRAGFTSFSVTAQIDADMTLEEKQAFLEEIDRRCPVSDNLAETSEVSLNVIE